MSFQIFGKLCNFHIFLRNVLNEASGFHNCLVNNLFCCHQQWKSQPARTFRQRKSRSSVSRGRSYAYSIRYGTAQSYLLHIYLTHGWSCGGHSVLSVCLPKHGCTWCVLVFESHIYTCLLVHPVTDVISLCPVPVQQQHTAANRGQRWSPLSLVYPELQQTLQPPQTPQTLPFSLHLQLRGKELSGVCL